MFHRDFLVPSGSGSGSGACLPSFLSFLFSGMGCPMNSLLHMNVVETWFVAVWGLCWCNFFGFRCLSKASVSQTFDPHSGGGKYFNMVPAMPLMEIFLARECDVHRRNNPALMFLKTVVPELARKTRGPTAWSQVNKTQLVCHSFVTFHFFFSETSSHQSDQF